LPTISLIKNRWDYRLWSCAGRWTAPAGVPLYFEPFYLAFNNFTNELGTPIWADQIVYAVAQAFRQSDDSGFHSKRRPSHRGVVTDHRTLSIRS
jgi:hypothetical protein